MTEDEFASKEREYKIAGMLLINSAASNLALICGFKPSNVAVMALLLFAASAAVEGDNDAVANMKEICRNIIDDNYELPEAEGIMQ